MNSRVTLKDAVRFHGHLGPYLVLGLLAGEFAIKKIGADKYFGLKVRVEGANKKPQSCLIDGLQLSTGATYGKGNIQKLNGNLIRIGFYNKINKRRITLKLKEDVIKKLDAADTHKGCEYLAKMLYRQEQSKIFNLTAGR